MTKPFSVDLWGSHPDEDNDDCWTGLSFDNEGQAREAFGQPKLFFKGNAVDWVHSNAFVVLEGVNAAGPYREVRALPDYNSEAAQKARDQDAREWVREQATQLGMGIGISAFNEAMGWGP
jgi:hypothetical protein